MSGQGRAWRLVTVLAVLAVATVTLQFAAPVPVAAASNRVVAIKPRARATTKRTVRRVVRSAPAHAVTSLGQIPGSTASPGPRTVALTFDDGPTPEYTRQILDILDQYQVKATFFLLGQQVARNPDLAREIVRRGHSIANHTWDHPALNKLSAGRIDSEISRTDTVIQQATGLRPTCVRPPYGAINQTVISRINGSFHNAVDWNVDPLDWKKPGAAAIVNRVLSGVRPNSIVLMHDGGGDRSETVAALPYVISALRSRGYSFSSICAPYDPRSAVVVPTPPAPPVAAPTPAPEPTTTTTTTPPTTTPPTTTTTAP